MSGIPKYKELLLFRHMKEIICAIGVILVFFAVNHWGSGQNAIEADLKSNSYKVIYHDTQIGVVYEQDTANVLYEEAMNILEQEAGRPLAFTEKLEFYLEHAKPEDITDEETLMTNLVNTLRNHPDTIKTKAYVLQIGGDFKVALEDEDSIKKVLKIAQSAYIDDIDNYDIQLVELPFDPSMKVPQVVQLHKPIVDTTDTIGIGEGDEEEIEQAMEPIVVDVDFAETIQVYESYVQAENIHSIDTAAEMITKENIEDEVYTVKKGDVPSVIAEDHDMSLSDLYVLNPGLKDQKYIHIGDELVVNVPQAELSVAAKEQIIYTEPVERPIEYIKNPNKFEGYTSTISNGYDGIKEVTAQITKVNGVEDYRKIVSERIIKEPKAKVIEKGSKPLPSKGATGKYIMPVVGGRLTSPFGPRWGSFHHGIDFACSTGTTIRASDGGKVVFAGWKSNTYGYTVDIDHGDGILTRYAHCSKIVVKKGKYVSQYQKIAEVGSTGFSTGPHVHFEIRFDNVAVNPAKYLD